MPESKNIPLEYENFDYEKFFEENREIVDDFCENARLPYQRAQTLAEEAEKEAERQKTLAEHSTLLAERARLEAEHARLEAELERCILILKIVKRFFPPLYKVAINDIRNDPELKDLLQRIEEID